MAVADLAGYIDTWVLRDAHQRLQKNQEDDVAEKTANVASDSDASSEDDDAVASDGHDEWIRNPNAKLIPKLPASPMVLSFSNHVPGPEGSANDDGSADYILAAITSSWNILAFHPRQGSLTPWSRRHPRKSLPGSIRDLLDLPKGVMWQESRMWVYGVSFLLMLDMGQDLPLSSQLEGSDSQLAQGMKRKRVGLSTGAGGKMGRESLMPSQIRKHGANDKWEDIDVAEKPEVDESDSDDDMPDVDTRPSRLSPAANGEEDVILPTTEIATNEPKKWWMTYKYRPILGIVPLSSASKDLEVALVERPTWDIDMAERYFGEEEWER
ncbi:hypothetical protein UVI_02018600 [Ustilaginoidea virens]|nr:hypothetical protein UVI_02018600 [Ustilaginoidea virens]